MTPSFSESPKVSFNTMKQRYLALDMLRGLTIFGMVFSAIIPYGVLPPWMYHWQNQPPTHELDMTCLGLSWVDLVFPIFIFCMGAAIPLAGRKSFGEIFKRFLMLWAFSYLYVFTSFTDIASAWAQALTLVGFIAFFPLYGVLSKNCTDLTRNLIRGGGLILMIAVIIIGHNLFGEVINHSRRGIIIFLLSWLYLFGASIWNLTAGKARLRTIIIGVLLAFTTVGWYFGWQGKLYAMPRIRWWFNLEEIYFLLLLLPATFIGEQLVQWREAGQSDQFRIMTKSQRYWAAVLALAAIVITVGVLYTSPALMHPEYIAYIAVLVLLWRRVPQYTTHIVIACSLLALAVIFSPLCGGLTKVPCTIAYCMTSCAVSTLLLIVMDFICHLGVHNPFVWTFAGAGQNPLMSYIAHGSLIVPLMNITGATALWTASRPADHPWIGVASSAVVVLITMAVVSVFSHKKIFWKA